MLECGSDGRTMWLTEDDGRAINVVFPHRFLKHL